MDRAKLGQRLSELIISASHGNKDIAYIRARDILDEMFPLPAPTFFLDFKTNEIVASRQNIYSLLSMHPVKTMPFLVDEWKAGRIRDVTPG